MSVWTKTLRTDAASFPYFYGDITDIVVSSEVARELELDLEYVSRENEAMSKRLTQWRAVAHLLAQRLRALPESGAARFPDARDRAALEEYDNLVKKTLDKSSQDSQHDAS